MRDLGTWLNDMSARPLPGGVAAASVAAAMGAALIAKALRVTLNRQQLAAPDRAVLEETLALNQAQQVALFRQADADVEAYQAVLDTRSLAAGDPARRRAWHSATEVPVAVAETCRLLLDRLPGVVSQCWSGVCVDFEIGSQLLRAGLRAGILAAEANLSLGGAAIDAGRFQARIEALLQADRTDEGSDGDDARLSGCDCL
ncbi:MAG: cyclodeaminase/cyclohydrolase family protein [Anaerolineae bacterium]|nr:cyclodeaminase/cyclohydrolase family protein [Anaerolineae bacterium]